MKTTIKILILLLIAIISTGIFGLSVLSNVEKNRPPQPSEIHDIPTLLKYATEATNRKVELYTYLVTTIPDCTAMACPADRPCCNICSRIYLKAQNANDPQQNLFLCEGREKIICDRTADRQTQSCQPVCRLNDRRLPLSGGAGLELAPSPAKVELTGRLVQLDDGDYCLETSRVEEID